MWQPGPGERAAGVIVVDRARPAINLKQLQIMTGKRLVQRRESGRLHVYTATASRDQTQRQLVRDLVQRAFQGSAAQLVLQALGSGHASPEELTDIRRLLAQRRGKRR